MSLAQNHDGDNTLCKLDTRLSISPETLLTTVEVQDSSKPSFFTKPAEKLAHLDGLRGIAALWVWFIHFVPYISKSLLPFLLGYQKWNASVSIFFILSGRVISLSVLKSGNVRQLVSCVIRRPFRLGLPVISIMMMDYFVFKNYKISSFSETILTPIWFLFDNSMRPSNITYSVWTISYEYQYSNMLYALTLVIMQFPQADSTRYVILGLAYLWFQITHNWMSHFVAGLFLADLSLHGYLNRFRQWKFSTLVQIGAFLLSVVIAFDYSFLPYSVLIDKFVCANLYQNGKQGVTNSGWKESFVVFVFCFTVMFCIETSTWLQRFFSHRIFVFLGRISFTLYLLHVYWLNVFALKFNNYIKVVFVDCPELGVCVSFVTSTCLLTLVSYLLIPIIDTPSIWAGKWVERALTEEWTVAGILTWWKQLPRSLLGYVQFVLKEWYTVIMWAVGLFTWMAEVQKVYIFKYFFTTSKYSKVDAS
ncbi:hypothetical protein BDV3_003767 [Batrachochytrium dendrobatidis]|nr:hypothetical protein O5D80_005548 [Batrachochytrium dendrobatidis]KAK5669681.1 hypothetical protein QVD99_004070 [Batrachochytrium dendrobatidis]